MTTVQFRLLGLLRIVIDKQGKFLLQHQKIEMKIKLKQSESVNKTRNVTNRFTLAPSKYDQTRQFGYIFQWSKGK